MANISQIEVNNQTYDLKDANSIRSTEKGAANGVASLGADGKVPAEQLPTVSEASVSGTTLIL